MPSKSWGCRSKTLTPTPDPAGYCANDAQENPEVVRRSIELWNEGDLAAFVALHHPDVVVVPPDNWPDGEVTRGRKPGFVRA